MSRVIIDCDPGMDDALALMLAAASEEIEIEMVTAVAGNRVVETTALNARRVLDFVGSRAPVYSGAARPLSHPAARTNEVHGVDGLGGADFPLAGAVAAGHAPDRIAEVLTESAGLTIVAIGPLTNLALAEMRSPGVLASTDRILLMGGAAFGQGNATPAAEFNIYADAIAAKIVFESGADIVMFGLDVTRRAAVTHEWAARLAGMNNRTAELVNTMLTFYFRDEFLLHDPCPVAYLARPDLFDGIRAHTQVDITPGPAMGKTHVWHDVVESPPGPENSLVVTAVDAEEMLAMLVSRLSTLP